jgi:superfamily II DNA/RNA helicase
VTAETTQADRPAPISDVQVLSFTILRHDADPFQLHAAGLHPIMVQNIDLCGYKDPTPVQAYTIPAAVQNRDVIAIAQTGKHPHYFHFVHLQHLRQAPERQRHI